MIRCGPRACLLCVLRVLGGGTRVVLSRALCSIVTACVLGVACGSRDLESSLPASQQRPRESPRGDELRPVVLPDVSRLAEPVQRQVRERFASLTEKLANRSTSQAEQADGYADLGRLLLAARIGGMQ